MSRRHGFGLFTLVMVALLVGLGHWQLERRLEKHALIAALAQRLEAAPEPLPAPSQWNALTAANDEFYRVSFAATYARAPDVMVYSSGSAVRADVLGPGTWAFLPARLASGQMIVVNAGFVENAMQDRVVEDRAVAKLLTGVPVALTGYLRFPESAGFLTPAENRASRLWFVRDQLAMAHALGWGEVAPFYIDLEAPVPPSGVPRPGPLQLRLKDNHMQYAITWFGLACAVLIAFGAWWLRQS